MRFLLFLAIASTALAAPKKQPAPAAAETVTKADIQRTLEHIQELSREQAKELDAAKDTIASQKTSLDVAANDIDAAKIETARVQSTIDTQRARIAAQDAKIAKYHRLLVIVCTALSTVAALLVFEILKPTGLIGAAFAFQPWIRYAAPVAVFAIVFGASWAIL